jgi:exodeoxyribonuclease V gamma subunit
MLEAVLSARRVLYVSWAGRSVRDNSDRSRLRCWCRSCVTTWPQAGPGEVLAQRTTEHPLQPFSRRYFEQAGRASARRRRTSSPTPANGAPRIEVRRGACTAAPRHRARVCSPRRLPPLGVASLARVS